MRFCFCEFGAKEFFNTHEIYRQLSCWGDENHAYGRMTLGVFPPDPKFRGYPAH